MSASVPDWKVSVMVTVPVESLVGGHIHQVIDTVHILFDNLRDRILYRFRIRARVGCGDRHCWWRNRRILRYRQFEDRECACHHDDDGDHPGEYRAIDKEKCLAM